MRKSKPKNRWSYMGEQGKRIYAVLKGTKLDDSWAAAKRWEEHLAKVMQFPFDAEIWAADDRGPLRGGDRVRVKGICLLDDSYGVIMELRLGRKRYDHPLYQLRPIDKNDPNSQIIDDYANWFANP